MFKITLVTSNYDNSYTFNKICKKLTEEHCGDFEFSFFKSNTVDKSDEEYRKLENEIRTSNIVYILLHGGVSSFKKFINLKKTF